MKNITPIKAMTTTMHRCIKYESTPIINLSLDSIVFEGESSVIKKLNDFYERFSNSFLEFSQNKFYEFALSDFSSDENPRKKYRYVPFELILRITKYEQNNNIFCVNMEVSVFKKRKKLARKTISHNWKIGKRNIYLSLRNNRL